MESLIILALAAFMGLASVDLFGCFWLSLLGVVATLVLGRAGALRGRAFWARLHGHLARAMLCGGLLAGAMVVYVRHLGLGMTEMESMAYLMGVVLRMVPFALHVRGRIEALFWVDGEDPRER